MEIQGKGGQTSVLKLNPLGEKFIYKNFKGGVSSSWDIHT